MPRLDVQPGQDISGPLEDAIESGAEVTIPGGGYTIDNLGVLTARVSEPTLIEGDGMVTLDWGSHSSGNDVATFEADGTTLTLRNITTTGITDGGKMRHKPRVPNGGELRLENFHIEGGAEDGSNVTGLMFDQTYGDDGTVYFEGGSISQCGNNGIYHSQEINVRLVVRNSRIEHCNSDLIRVGGRNDLIEGNAFVMEHKPPRIRAGETATSGRAIRMDESGSVTVRSNDFIYTWSGAASCVVTTDAAVGGSIDVSNNRFRHEGSSPVLRTDGSPTPTLTGGGNHLTGANTSTRDGFDAVVACAGPDCDAPDGAPDLPEGEWTEIVIICTQDGAELDYQIAVSADRVRKITSGDNFAEGNDEVLDNGDGTYTIDGYTGNAGYGDSFEMLNGDITSVSMTDASNPDAAELRVGGEDVTDQWLGDDPSPPENGGGGNGDQSRRRAGMAVGAAALLGLAVVRERNRE